MASRDENTRGAMGTRRRRVKPNIQMMANANFDAVESLCEACGLTEEETLSVADLFNLAEPREDPEDDEEEVCLEDLYSEAERLAQEAQDEALWERELEARQREHDLSFDCPDSEYPW